MKSLAISRKDLIYLGVIALIIAVVAMVGYQQLGSSGSSSKGTTVEVVQPVGANLSQAELDILNDSKQTKNFAVPVDLSTGVGNTAPFGQF